MNLGFCGLLQVSVIPALSYYGKLVLFVLGAVTYVRDADATAKLLRRDDVDAIEIHTSGR